MERVLILLKPDCLERRLWGRAMAWLQEQTDLHIHYVATVKADGEKLELHYHEHKGKDFYPGLLGAMMNRWMIAISGSTEAGIPAIRDAVFRFRRSYQTDGPRNLMHCSDSEEAAIRETLIWFGCPS